MFLPVLQVFEFIKPNAGPARTPVSCKAADPGGSSSLNKNFIPSPFLHDQPLNL
jgi:hypothetical protein